MIAKFAALSLAAGTAIAALALPTAASAQLYLTPGYVASSSPATTRFVALATTTSNFIDAGSRLAIDISPNPRVRSFARQAIVEENRAHNTMTAWADVAQPLLTGRSAYVPGLVGVVTAPLALAVNTGLAVTGERIVATTDGTAVTADQSAMLNQLSGLRGRDFDGAYLRQQIDAHQRLIGAYATYAANGDDPALRSMASSELPRLQSDLRRLNSF